MNDRVALLPDFVYPFVEFQVDQTINVGMIAPKKFNATHGRKTTAVFAYRGTLDPRIARVHKSMDKQWRESIELKKF